MQHAIDRQTFRVSDYFQWPDELRCELIDGVVYDMTPAPTLAHQTTVKRLTLTIEEGLRQFRKGPREG
ncbi:hypothetical protein [Endothiovibrio diazotrophicus]